MICPECNGVGGVRVRFLLFFTRRARCKTCLGTGQFPPPRRMSSRPPYRDDDDDSYDDRRTVVRDEPSPSIMSSALEAEPPLEIGRGGASGGGGAGASWDTAEERDAPVIVDPFASEASSSDAIESESSSSSDDSSGSSDSDSTDSSDSGTSY